MSKVPILTSPAGQGGIVAQDGFDYQVYYGLFRIAEWLADPTFEGVMFEAIEDIEARFFAPQTAAGHLLVRIQAKSSASLSRADILAVLDNFVAFEQAFPRITRGFELATPQTPAKMIWIQKDLERVRFAGPFYAPFRQVLDASDQVVKDNLIGDLGHERANLLFSKGTIVLQATTGVAGALAAFADIFERSFPDAPPINRRVFDDLVALAQRSKKVFLTRRQIISVLEAGLKTKLESAAAPCLYLRGDRPGNVPSRAIQIDAAFLSGEGRLSPYDQWETLLIGPLRRVKTRWQAEGERRIFVDGNCRLTSAFSVGAVFSAGSGFDLDIQTKDGVWRTDDHANADTLAPLWITTPSDILRSGTLSIAVGVLRDPSETLIAAGMPRNSVTVAFLAEAVTSAQQMQALVASLKRFISGEVTRLKATRVDLYFAGPAVMAMAIGHRWNAIAGIQFHEFDSTNNIYAPTALIAG